MDDKALEFASIDWKKIDWKKNIRTNIPFLLLNIDTTSLEGHLKSNHVLQPLTIRRIWGNKDETTRISQLLDQILLGDETRLRSFCKALHGSDQSHIVTQYIEKIHRPEDTTDAVAVQQSCLRKNCLSNLKRDQLHKHWNEIIAQLESHAEFVNLLQCKEVLTPLQIKRLKDINLETARNEAILNYMERTSEWKYLMFCCALRESGQEHIEHLLEVTSTIVPSPAQTVGNEGGNEGTSELCGNNSQKSAMEHTSSVNVAEIEQETTRGPLQETLQSVEDEETSSKSLENNRGTTEARAVEQRPGQDLESEQGVRSPMQCEDNELEGPIDDANAVPVNSPITVTPATASFPIEATTNRATIQAQANPENVAISLSEASRIEVPQPPAEPFAVRHQPVYRADQTIFIERHEVTEQKIREVQERIRNDDAYSTVCDAASGTQGLALIISNEHFTNSSLSTRDGTQVDVKNLRNLFAYLNFRVKVLENLPAQQIIETCQNESRDSSRRQNRVFVCCVLSHGSTGTVKGVDGVDVKLDDIYNYFDGKNCEFLRGKPKIFLIQACQGDKMSKGVPSNDATDSQASGPETVDNPQIPPQPNLGGDITDNRKHEKADMAFLLATFAGYVAWRSGTKGSYFVQHITHVFSQYAHEEHFADMVPKLMNLMNHSKMDKGYKQICEFRTTLDKKLYLLPKIM